jgi:hypothetical protein
MLATLVGALTKLQKRDTTFVQGRRDGSPTLVA